MPKSEEFEIPTPFGKVNMPFPSIPKLAPPNMDEHRMQAMKHAIAIDLSSVVAIIPVVGDIVADVVEDLHGSTLRKTLTPDELNEYTKQDKVAPSAIALLRVFMRK